MLVMPSPPIIMADQEQLIVSPVSISASSTASASLAATLTPGTPTALDEQKHVISLSDTIKHLSTSPSISTSTSTGLGIPATAGGPPSTSSETSSSSLDDDYYYEDGDEGVDDDMDYAYNEDDYGTELRHQRAKRAARILLAQCLLEVRTVKHHLPDQVMILTNIQFQIGQP